MNAIDKIWETNKDISGFADKYFEYLFSVLKSLDTTALAALEIELEDARAKGNTIFVAGNGGSAATATTMANDLGFDVYKKSGIDKPFKVLAITDNTSVITAISNDVGYDNVFLGQLQIHYKAGDKIIVISASGNSPNIVKAAEWVKSKGGKVIGFLGFQGGKLKEICDVVVHVKTEAGEYGPVEDAHLIINHVLAHWFQKKLKK